LVLTLNSLIESAQIAEIAYDGDRVADYVYVYVILAYLRFDNCVIK